MRGAILDKHRLTGLVCGCILVIGEYNLPAGVAADPECLCGLVGDSPGMDIVHDSPGAGDCGRLGLDVITASGRQVDRIVGLLAEVAQQLGKMPLFAARPAAAVECVIVRVERKGIFVAVAAAVTVGAQGRDDLRAFGFAVAQIFAGKIDFVYGNTPPFSLSIGVCLMVRLLASRPPSACRSGKWLGGG